MKAIGLDYSLEIPDAEVSGRVMATLAHDGQVKTDDVRVFVEDGVVTLLGTVDTPREGTRAERLALRVPEVKRVDNRLTVAIDQYLDDNELLERVREALESHPRTAGKKLGATIEQGVVTLEGRVDTLAAEQAAVKTAEKVKGVRQVTSAIKIGEIEPTDQPIPVVDDASLRSEVTAAISDAGVTIYQNESYVRDGIAYLTGFVQGRRALRRALEAAEQVPGLQGVRNELSLQADPSSRNPDEALIGRVLDAFLQDGRVSPKQITAMAANGVVVLAGQVDSIEDHDAALQIVADVPGVTEVVDNIRILGRQPKRSSDRKHMPFPLAARRLPQRTGRRNPLRALQRIRYRRAKPLSSIANKYREAE